MYYRASEGGRIGMWIGVYIWSVIQGFLCYRKRSYYSPDTFLDCIKNEARLIFIDRFIRFPEHSDRMCWADLVMWSVFVRNHDETIFDVISLRVFPARQCGYCFNCIPEQAPRKDEDDVAWRKRTGGRWETERFTVLIDRGGE